MPWVGHGCVYSLQNCESGVGGFAPNGFKVEHLLEEVVFVVDSLIEQFDQISNRSFDTAGFDVLLEFLEIVLRDLLQILVSYREVRSKKVCRCSNVGRIVFLTFHGTSILIKDSASHFLDVGDEAVGIRNQLLEPTIS